MNPRSMRRLFFRDLARGLAIIWPIVSALVLAIPVLGVVIAWLERWPLADGIYFSFITTLTIGYGDLVPRRPGARAIAVVVGVIGVLLIAILAALAVRAMETVTSREDAE